MDVGRERFLGLLDMALRTTAPALAIVSIKHITGHRGRARAIGSARGRQAGRLLVRLLIAKTGIPHTGRAETGCQLGGFPYGNLQHTPMSFFADIWAGTTAGAPGARPKIGWSISLYSVWFGSDGSARPRSTCHEVEFNPTLMPPDAARPRSVQGHKGHTGHRGRHGPGTRTGSIAHSIGTMKSPAPIPAMRGVIHADTPDLIHELG